MAVFLYVAAFFKSEQLPGPDKIRRQLYRSPVQTKAHLPAFKATRAGITYTITPLYHYHIYGLVVSPFNTATWWNYYHPDWRDFLNIKDLCVIWGNNLKNDAYQKMRFNSLSFECHWSCFSQDDCARFDRHAISNNHLLSANKEVSELIMSVKKGDQIYLGGYLAEYSHSNGEFHRGTSTSREDEGSHACETVYVKKIRILKRANPQWHLCRRIAKYAVFAFIILLLITHFKAPAYE